VKRPWRIDTSISPFDDFRMIEATKADWEKVQEAFKRCPVPGMVIKRIQVISNPDIEAPFEAKVRGLQKGDSNPAIRPKWKNPGEEAGDLGLRQRFAEKLEDMARPNSVTEAPAVKVVSMWHGTSCEAVDHIGQEGFAKLASTDIGFFGKGIYGTWEVKYAYDVYCKGKEEGGKDGALLLCWFCTRNYFPVIGADKDKFRAMDAKGKYVSTANYKNYDSHFAPVKMLGAAAGLPCDRDDEVQFHELVVFESSQCLPRYHIELTPGKLDTVPTPVQDQISTPPVTSTLGSPKTASTSKPVPAPSTTPATPSQTKTEPEKTPAPIQSPTSALKVAEKTEADWATFV
jgi:hypothetical protein